jgi:alpha-tubulin suppressor-like RCC1 family protein
MKKIIFTYSSLGFLLLTTSLVSGQNLQISGGNNYSAAVCDNQVVNVWGANSSGQLGTASAAAFVSSPTPVTTGNTSNTATSNSPSPLPPIRLVDAGSGAHLLGLDCNKQVYAWGENANGQLGRNSFGAATPANNIPSRVLRGAQGATINATYDPSGLFLNNIVYVSGGNNFSMAVEATTGRVLTWGQNNYGQLGDGTTIDRSTPVYVLIEGGTTQLTNIVSLEGGDACAYALDASGHVWSWGITHDASNNAFNLGRTPTATIAGQAGGANLCAPKAGMVVGDNNPLISDYSTTCSSTPLANIVQISGGDAHGLALDANGNVWSFGGDWAQGQLGRGVSAVYQQCAQRVVAPGVVTNGGGVATNFLGSGVDGKALYIAAGQASSAVAMANGKVVTFGVRGMYASGLISYQTGSNTCAAGGEIIASGTLGDGNSTQCNSTSCQPQNTAGTYSTTPVYVTGIPATEKVTQVSDGDAWYYAITDQGNTYTWGFNRRGELGMGDYVDRCSAALFPAPSNCIGGPCPQKPSLGADRTLCPGAVSEVLNTNVSDGANYTYKWEKSTTMPATWSTVNTNPITFVATSPGYYRVTIHDTRAGTAALCGPCPDMIDTIQIIQLVNPFTPGCTGVDATNPAQRWAQISSNQTCPGSNFDFFTTPTGGSALLDLTTPNNDSLIKATTAASTLYVVENCGSIGPIIPATTVATAPCPGGRNQETGDRSPLLIKITDDLILSDVSFIQPTGTGTCNYQLEILANDGTVNCGGCTPSNSKYGPNTLLYTTPATSFISGTSDSVRTIRPGFQVTGSPTSPVYYWLRIKNGCNVQAFVNCTPANSTAGAFPVWTGIPANYSSTPAGAAAIFGLHDNNPNGTGALFNLKFNVVSDYNVVCGRYSMAISSSTAGSPCSISLPVGYISFTGNLVNDGVNLEWVTSFELNTKYFSIQRSTNGRDFTELSRIKATNTIMLSNYNYVDNLQSVKASEVYYRIVSVSADGEESFTNIISLDINGIKPNVEIAPNPNNGSFKVSLNRTTANLNIKVVDLTGRQVYSTIVSENSVTIDLRAVNKGIYFVQVSDGNDNWIEKIIVE